MSSTTIKNNMKENYTIMKFKSLKEKHPDALLLFRYGDVYITYDEDAVTASRVLGITLIRRSEGYDMAGFPTVLLDDSIPKLIRAGHRIAICDQIGFA